MQPHPLYFTKKLGILLCLCAPRFTLDLFFQFDKLLQKYCMTLQAQMKAENTKTSGQSH